MEALANEMESAFGLNNSKSTNGQFVLLVVQITTTKSGRFFTKGADLRCTKSLLV